MPRKIILEKNLENSLIAKYLANPRLVILLLLLIITLGIYSFLTLPRTLNPEIKIPIVLVQTVLPGASPKDVESLVTIPLEDSIRGVQKIDTLQSTSQDSVSAITAQFQSGVDPDKAKQDVQSAVDSATTLPADAKAPQVIKLDFQNQPVWTFSLITRGDDGSLFRFAQDLQQKLKDLPEIDKAQVSGLEDQEVQITIKPEAIAAYNINPLIIIPLVSNALNSFPAGPIRTHNSIFSLSIDPEVISINDIRNLQINLNNQNIALSEIALISQHPIPDQNQSFLVYAKSAIHRSVTFNVFRTSSVNIDTAIAAAQTVVNQRINVANRRFQVATLINTSEEIDKQYFDLGRDFTITIILVVAVLFVFLGARQALVSALSAPLSFLITFSVMKATGITLNFLSLFSLLLSLGLLVDDTVVVISAVTAYYRKYKLTPLQTGLLVWKDFLIPIITTTTTTVFAFLPMLLSTGIIGEFIKSIPVVVSTALAGSFFVSLFIILPLIIILLKPNIPHRVKVFLEIFLILGSIGIFSIFLPKNNPFVFLQIMAFIVLLAIVYIARKQLWNRLVIIPNKMKDLLGMPEKHSNNQNKSRWSPKNILNNGIISFAAIENDYTRLIEQIVCSASNRRKALIIVVLFFLFSMSLVPLGFVKNEFFPKTDENLIYINVEYPAGTYIADVKKETLSLLRELKNTPHIKFVTADIGITFSTDQGGSGSGSSNNVLFAVILAEKNKRNTSSIGLAQDLRQKYEGYEKGTLSVQEISGGPPAGADVQIKILGDDLQLLDNYANSLISYLKSQKGVANISKSIKSGTSKITFVPDKIAISQNQTSIDQIGMWLRAYASGLDITKIKLEGLSDKKNITFRLAQGTNYVDSLNAINIPTLAGTIPLSSLGKFVLETNPTLITREEGKRTISVSASVEQGFNIQDINTNVEKFADSKLNLASGYSWKTGGVNEENQKSVISILQAMIISFLLIIITMVIQFSSFRRALIVMLVIPLSISGVFIVFALTQTPLSFPALIGILALFGIVVKNSILIVDRIVENEKQGMRLVEAIGEASASRLEPIALTTFATIMGLVPITLTDPLWRGLGGAIISGLAFSGTIMLFFIPVVYFYLMRRPTSR